MSLVFRNEIDITVWLAGATIADVAIRSRSRPPLTRLFAGKPAESLVPVLPRLFSLCSVAHQVAYLTAIETASGQEVTQAAAQRRVTAVVAERLTELLRSLFVGGIALDGGSAGAVRAMMQASAVLGVASEGVPATSRRQGSPHWGSSAKVRLSRPAARFPSMSHAARARHCRRRRPSRHS